LTCYAERRLLTYLSILGSEIAQDQDSLLNIRRRFVSFLRGIGESFLVRWRLNRDMTAVIGGVLFLAVQPRFWPRTVRNLLARQILFTGINALGLVSFIAVLAGVSVVAQAQYWLSNFGQSAMLGPILVAVIIREAGPLLVSFVVIARSGTAIATELANMRVRGEVDVLDAQGVDPMVYLVMPRVLGVVASVFCLTVVLIAVSLGSGFLFGVLLGVAPGDWQLFAGSVIGAITPADIANLLAKTILPGLFVGVICSRAGLCIRGSVTDVPRAATSGVVRSLAAVLAISAIASVLTYV
jgi:phospholipid/cholesterol/gamma-HCH transport system permease protein